MIIYKITNIHNGDFYIGKTIGTLESRWKGHLSKTFKRNSKIHFHCAIRKYGPDSFLKEIIGNAYSEKELDNLEFILIRDLKPQYNSKEGGMGGRQSPEVLRKISNTLKGRSTNRKGKPGPKLSEAAKQKLRDHFTGRPRKPFSEETKRKMSQSKIGNKNAKKKV